MKNCDYGELQRGQIILSNSTVDCTDNENVFTFHSVRSCTVSDLA
jgi:hypothetical protein